MTKRETTDTSRTGSNKPEPSQGGGQLQSQHIRLADEDWQALEDMARAERKQTGSMITASGLARRFIRQELKRAGHVIANATTTVIV